MGSIIIDIEGFYLSKNDIRRISHPIVCGIILFSRNFENTNQLNSLIKHIKEVRNDLLITVDHEGGRVQRFKEGFSSLPPMLSLEPIFKKDPQLALTLAKFSGWIIGKELGSYHIDLNYSPVLDLHYGKSGVIGDRSFASDPKIVIELVKYFIRGLDEAGMTAVGKHFPGHGYIKADTHLQISEDTRTLIEMEPDVLPFNAMIDYDIKAIMPSHVLYPKIDNQPASLSHYWLNSYLRKTLHFKGVVISDDLNMKGVSNYITSIEKRTLSAFSAGCDIVLICNNHKDVDRLLQSIDLESINSNSFSSLRLNIEKNRKEKLDGLSIFEIISFMKKNKFVKNS